MYASKLEACVWEVGGCSLSAAGGRAGLVEAHGFAQIAGKVHFLDFGSFDEGVTLEENQRSKPLSVTLAQLTEEKKKSKRKRNFVQNEN